MDTKQCSRCRVVKGIEEFRVAPRYKGGRSTWCKQCADEYRREWEAAKRAGLLPTKPQQAEGDAKTCTRCHTAKTLDEFGAAKATTDGLNPWCRQCVRDYQREWARQKRATDPVFAEKARQASRKHKRAMRADEAKKEQIRQQQRDWYARRSAEPDFRERRRVYRQERERPQRMTDEARRRRNEKLQRRREVDPEARLQGRLAAARYTARKHGATVGEFTKADWGAMVQHYGGRCAYCGRPSDRLEQDHVIPLAQGGQHHRDNIVPACRSCNASKNNRTPEQAGMRIVVRVDEEKQKGS